MARTVVPEWWFERGFADLEGSLATVRRRIARGRERPGDRAEAEAIEASLAEFRALHRDLYGPPSAGGSPATI